MSEVRIQLVRRFSAAAVLAEKLESRLINGEQIDISEISRLASTLVRLSERIGLARSSRDITPTLSDYLAKRTEAEPAEDAKFTEVEVVE
jgi:hypothetical protein